MAVHWREDNVKKEEKAIAPQRRASIFSCPYDPEEKEPLIVQGYDISKTDKEMSWLFGRLKSLTLFGIIEGPLFHELLKLMYSRKVKKGEIVLDEHDTERTFFVIQKSRDLLTAEDDITSKRVRYATQPAGDDVNTGLFHINEMRENEKVFMATLRENECYNVIALLHKPKKLITVTAASNGIIWLLERHHYSTIVAGQSYRERGEKLNLLESVPLFKNLSDTQKSALADAMKPTYFEDREIILPKCRRITGLYFIREGNVTHSDPRTKDHPTRVIKLCAGQRFGLDAFTSKDLFMNGTAHAVGEVYAWHLGKADVLRLVGPLEASAN